MEFKEACALVAGEDFWKGVCAALVVGWSLTTWYCFLSKVVKEREGRREADGRENVVNPAVLQRKRRFCEHAGATYGYRHSPMGFIDYWRATELPALIPPQDLSGCVEKSSSHSTTRATRSAGIKNEPVVYLDYAGAALPIRSQLDAIRDNSLLQLRSNPHSSGPVASETATRILEAKARLLTFLDGHPGKYCGTCTPPSHLPAASDERDWHPGYELVFTSNATDALLRVAENFDWSRNKSLLVYPQEAHTSVVGMRQGALEHGASFVCRPADDLESDVKQGNISEWQQPHDDSSSDANHLFVWPAECNFSGVKRDLEVAKIVSRRKGWYTMLDLAKYAGTNPVSLAQLDPDYCCLSLYKIFGVPTNLGCLAVKRTSLESLQPPHKRSYFGGGSVDVVLAQADYVVPRSVPSHLASWNHGTCHFDGICNMVYGLDVIQALGGIAAIQTHTQCLAVEFIRRLKELRHDNEKNAILIYGAWSRKNEDDISCDLLSQQGPTVAFNVLWRDGTFVGYNQVEKLAELNSPPLQFRTGCFCNPGACQLALGLGDADIRHHYDKAGKVCGDHNDVIEGRPTGAIRVSFGKDSIWEDLDAMIVFLDRTFVSKAAPTEEIVSGQARIPNKVVLSEIYVFPIKSCAAMSAKQWTFDTQLRPLWDREFAIVDASGGVMRLQRYPRMAYLQPKICLQRRLMTLSAPGKTDLSIDLKTKHRCGDGNEHPPSSIVNVCGSKCGALLWGSAEVSDWLSEYIGVPCWLARHAPSPKLHAFANEEPVLLVSNNAVAAFNSELERHGQKRVCSKRFRPNLVVEQSVEITGRHLEDSWKEVRTSSGATFDVVGPCARCSMVDLDPKTGRKSQPTLRALAHYRRGRGQITFGIFLRGRRSDKEVILKLGDCLSCR